MHRQAGLSLPAVIVIVVILGIVGAGLVNLTATSNVAVGNEVLSIRAFMAAESGAQNGMARLFPLGGGAAQCNTLNVNFNNAGLIGCSASITCTGPVSIGGHDMYTLTSTGQCGSGESVASRTLRVGARTL